MRNTERCADLKRGAVFALTLILAATIQTAASGAIAGPKAVLELFTSQGCSSCPPADRLLGKLINRDDIIALSLPVDYWDYLGWKDTLASAEYTRRQHDYRASTGAPHVYTPQIVVNGVAHAVGSRLSEINSAINKSRKKLSKMMVPVRMWADKDTIYVEAGAAPSGASKNSATLWLALITKSKSVAIHRGENSGRNITYYNVVRQMTPIGEWNGKKMVIKLPKDHLMDKESDGCTVLLQKGKAGPIIGAAELRNW